MTDSDYPHDIAVANDRSLKKLVRAITNSQGNFRNPHSPRLSTDSPAQDQDQE
jgi:hypothetical protein